MKKKIYIDIDDVLTNNLEMMLKYLNGLWGQEPLKVEDISTWEFLRKIFSRKEIEKSFEFAIENAEFKPCAEEALSELYRKKDDIYILTATLDKFKEKRMIWIDEKLRWFPKENIIFEKNKEKYSGGILVDDAIHNIEKYDGVCFLVDMPHNINKAIEKEHKRVPNLSSAVNFILNKEI